ncbi:MAG: 2,3-bisphosphoglycerate-independent phosphoglycerate mutase, partial [Peptococcaceae bacterium]|nr:2,3-bisphosphoglycerate-independent phosphoglycerate mutase [Peptococcaceae bacterium]
MILDGWGISEQTEGNAIAQSSTPNMDKLLATYPHSQLLCSGEAVGLPDGQQGNSEVGHLNLGAGRVVYQELTRINKAVREHTLQENTAFQQVMDDCIAHQKPLHLMGLVSPGGVHSHSDHLYGLLELARDKQVPEVYVHCFLDGRDVGPSTGLGFVQELEDKLAELGIGKIAT